MTWVDKFIPWKRRHQPDKFLFVHIQKTAGSSIVEMAKERYGNNTVSHGDFLASRPEDLAEFQFVSGHFGFEYASYLIDSRYSFTFLRDPMERILSYYYYNRGRDKDEFPMTRIAHELDLEKFLAAGLSDPLVKSRIWNNQTWQLALGYESTQGEIDDFDPAQLLDMAMQNLNRFSYIGLTETFDDDLDVILPNLGLEQDQASLHINKTANRAAVCELSPPALDLLKQLTDLDYQLYERAKELRSALRAKMAGSRNTIVREK